MIRPLTTVCCKAARAAILTQFKATLTGGNESNTSTGSSPPGPSLCWRSS